MTIRPAGTHKRIKVTTILLFALLATGAHADTLRFDSDRTQIVFAEGRERARLRGNARIVTDTTVINADEVELYGENYRYALCKGNVRVVDTEKDFTLTSERLFLDRRDKITRAEGNAVMENRKDEIVIKGGFIESREGTDVSIVQIGVRILKQDMVARSEFARYMENSKILELSGMPQVFWKGDEYRATRIVINIETDEIELQGEVSGSLKNTGTSDATDSEPEPQNGPTPEASAGTGELE